jgi:hypothetical protein
MTVVRHFEVMLGQTLKYFFVKFCNIFSVIYLKIFILLLFSLCNRFQLV